MNPEERVLLDRAVKLGEENNKILRSLKASQTWSRMWSIIWFLVVIAPLVASYIFLKPYLGTLEGSFKSAQDILKVYETGSLPN